MKLFICCIYGNFQSLAVQTIYVIQQILFCIMDATH